MTTPRIPAARIAFSAQDRLEILRMIDQSLQGGSLTLGPHTREFEEAFALRHDVAHAVAVSSGTSALEIIFRILAVKDREVVIPTNTFFATAAAAVHAGGIPRLADISADSLALSPETLEAALTPLTAVVVLVHIGGVITPEIDAIRSICDRRGIVLVEDAAHAHGASFEGRAAGTFGHAAAFSLYPTKVMTSGEGGMITTGDEQLRNEAIVYRDQGKSGFLGGDHVRMGYAWRMSELHAAVGLIHLSRLNEAIVTRRRVAARYDEALAGLPGCRPLSIPAASISNFYKYVALLDPGIDRAELKRELSERMGVSLSGEVYASPLHRQPIFADLDRDSFPVADNVCARHICLPVHSDMTDDEADYVAESLASVLAGRTVDEAAKS
ncbi:MAG TPA: DegT/DnrJ/EryC1/StrS family aminotransferase [Acidimicrobiales bacterium]|nr:DegT/DnrJ/EryC1/StrS family aminotransferase [Acidimicrobiales bacterium]